MFRTVMMVALLVMDGVQTWHASITIAFTLTLSGDGYGDPFIVCLGVSSMMKAL